MTSQQSRTTKTTHMVDLAHSGNAENGSCVKTTHLRVSYTNPGPDLGFVQLHVLSAFSQILERPVMSTSTITLRSVLSQKLHFVLFILIFITAESTSDISFNETGREQLHDHSNVLCCFTQSWALDFVWSAHLLVHCNFKCATRSFRQSFSLFGCDKVLPVGHSLSLGVFPSPNSGCIVRNVVIVVFIVFLHPLYAITLKKLNIFIALLQAN